LAKPAPINSSFWFHSRFEAGAEALRNFGSSAATAAAIRAAGDSPRRSGVDSDHGEEQRLTAIIQREGDGFVSLCPELDIASQGSSIEEARANLVEALTLFFEMAEASEISRRLHGETFVTQVEIPVGVGFESFQARKCAGFSSETGSWRPANGEVTGLCKSAPEKQQ
jgi:predicted RNase H-like HicB family nuclease